MSKRIWLLAAALAACTHAHGPEGSTQTGNPPALDRALVTLEVGADDVHITGEPGAVTPGGATIEITNLTTGQVTEGMAAPDGSFDVRVDGSPNDAFAVRVSANGEQSAPVKVVRGGAEIAGQDAGSLTCEPTGEIAVTQVDKLDLLFMVDDSGSMKQEQENLQQQLPRMIQILASGDRDLDGASDFPPAEDLHLGVVSSDLGLVGIQDIEKCNGLGDDGILQHEPSPAVTGCHPTYPPFLTYTAGVNQPAQTANDFACIAVLGTDGCGFGQPLESVLKALWPAIDPMPGPNGQNRITFLGDVNMFGQLGHGDNENAGFLRNDPVQGLSLIAIILITDKEDCSSKDTSHFTPAHYLDPNDPLAAQPLNLRCFYNKANLYPLERYINGYKALRPGNEHLVIFGAVVGVPPDLVEPDDYVNVDWASDAQRNAFYDRLLSDRRMLEVEDPTRTLEQGANLLPSCNTAAGVAYPPIRMVEVARGFGQNGTVHSICQQDLTPVIEPIISAMASPARSACRSR